MVRRILAGIMLLAVGAGIALAAAQADGSQGKKPRYSTKEVMQAAHKKGLLKKILAGDGDAGERLKLLEYYVALYENPPKKGDLASWTKKTADAVVAAAKLVVDPKTPAAELKDATSCAGCHKVHK